MVLVGCNSDDGDEEPVAETVNTADTSAKDDGQDNAADNSADDKAKAEAQAEAQADADANARAEAEAKAKAEADKEEEESGPTDLTGQWSYKHFVMTLRHSGTSVQGKIVDTDPNTSLKDVRIAGRSDGSSIQFEEIVTHKEGSEEEDYSVNKKGDVEDRNHFQIHTSEGPFPGWQRWTRII